MSYNPKAWLAQVYPVRSTPSRPLAAALAAVCGYHTGDGCQHCADTFAARRDRGMTESQIVADIELYRTNYPEWERKVRGEVSA